MSSEILISSRRLVDPFNLDINTITIEELLKPLAKLCRYTGQMSFDGFYSVAEHTVHLINKVPVHLQRAAALHDLNEGLTNDLPRPFKTKLPEYVAFETAIQKQIFARFDEPWEHMLELAEWDFNICADEMAHLFDGWVLRSGMKPLGVKIQCWEWREAEAKLRNAFKFIGLL